MSKIINVKKINSFCLILGGQNWAKIVKNRFQKRVGLQKWFCQCSWSICHEFVSVWGRPDMRSVCIFTSRNAPWLFSTWLVAMERFEEKKLIFDLKSHQEFSGRKIPTDKCLGKNSRCLKWEFTETFWKNADYSRWIIYKHKESLPLCQLCQFVRRKSTHTRLKSVFTIFYH